MKVGRRGAMTGGMAALVGAHASRATAGAYPERPVRIIVPYAPGQASDILGRFCAELLSNRWPQRVFVENKGGAGGAIGMESVARAAPDGYTLCYAAIGPMNIMPAMQPKVAYDPIRDFRVIAVISAPPVVLMVHPSFPARTLQEFVDYARANEVNYASGGPGSIQHVSGELMRLQFGLKLRHVPYRGSGPAAADVLAGVVPVMFDTVSSALPLVQSGRMRAIALTAGDGLASLPGVPSITNTLSKDYSVMGWSGMLAPAGIPDEIIEKVNRDLLSALDDPAIAPRLKDVGLVPAPRWSPAEAQTFVNGQTLFWRKVVQDAGLKIDG